MEHTQCPSTTLYTPDGSKPLKVRCVLEAPHNIDHMSTYVGMDLKPREIRWKN